MPLPQQHLGLGIGADLAAAVPALTWRWARRWAIAQARRRSLAAAPVPEIPGPLDAAWGCGPHPQAAHLCVARSAQLGGSANSFYNLERLGQMKAFRND